MRHGFRVVALWLLTLLMTVTRAAAPDAPAVRSIPGVTTVDTHPHGCVSCHIDMPDIGVDARFSTAIRIWEREVPSKLMAIAQRATSPGVTLQGKHPPVPLPLADIPSSCMACHGADSESAPPFNRLLHLAHYSGGGENHFLTQFGGECTLCHKMDPETGAWTLPSGQEK